MFLVLFLDCGVRCVENLGSIGKEVNLILRLNQMLFNNFNNTIKVDSRFNIECA